MGQAWCRDREREQSTSMDAVASKGALSGSPQANSSQVREGCGNQGRGGVRRERESEALRVWMALGSWREGGGRSSLALGGGWCPTLACNQVQDPDVGTRFGVPWTRQMY